MNFTYHPIWDLTIRRLRYPVINNAFKIRRFGIIIHIGNELKVERHM